MVDPTMEVIMMLLASITGAAMAICWAFALKMLMPFEDGFYNKKRLGWALIALSIGLLVALVAFVRWQTG